MSLLAVSHYHGVEDNMEQLLLAGESLSCWSISYSCGSSPAIQGLKTCLKPRCSGGFPDHFGPQDK